MDNQTVHIWASGGRPVKVLPDGSLLGRKRERQSKNDPTTADPPPPENSQPAGSRRRGGGWQDAIEFVQESWDGKEEWSFSNWDDDRTGVMMSRQHHDFQREGNPVGYYAPGQEFVKQGKTIILSHKNKYVPEISDRELTDDAIYEVDWHGNLTGFEWHGTDHFHELGFDESAKGVRYKDRGNQQDTGIAGDWLHINSMSLLGKNHWYDETGDERFNPENIIISSRAANFVAIFSRATGNITWRVGPDFSEGTPEHNLGQFFGQHHAHMIPRGLPGEGNILVFDNGQQSESGDTNVQRGDRHTRDYSRVIEFNPVTLDIVWQYGAESGAERFYSHNVSAAQRLPNGNTLITDGPNGRLFEVTPNKENVWEFIAPMIGERENAIYRAYRIPPEWIPGNPAGYAEWATLYE